jgi:uncharacterized protein (DUF58 family)
MLTPEDLRQIRRLSLQAGHRVDGLFAGGYRSAFRGRGMEFEEVRPYVPGDDVRHIDWNVTARANAPHVKEFKEERELTLLLAVDVSASMRFGSGGEDGRTDKRLQSARIAGALACAATRNNDRVGLLAYTDRVELLLPPRKSRGHAWSVIREIFEHRPQRLHTDLGVALEHMGHVLKRRAVICIVSDFLDVEAHARALGALASRHRVSAFVVTDPLEDAVRGVGLLTLEDAETGERRLVDAGRIYPGRPVQERLEVLSHAGVHRTSISTGEDPFRALQAHFRRLERLR